MDEAPFFVSFDDLFKSFNFFPGSGDTGAQRINSTFRFMLIAGSLIFLNYYDETLFYASASILVLSVFYFNSRYESFESPASGEARETLKPRLPDSLECRRPTPDNPFSNYLLTDPADRPAACDPEEVAEEIKDYFYANLYRDTTDLYEKKNSQRQFYSMPNTRVANDQSGFARACFGDSGRLKALGQRYFSPS